jgi:ribosomal protein S18 acetylase RimI-like enzyme
VILLEDLIIHQDFRGHGLGSKLLNHALNYAKTKDFKRITLLTDRINADAQRFYKRHGFFESGMLPMRYVLSDDCATHAPKEPQS